MDKITHCPSTLAPEHIGYSPLALKRLFDKQKVSHIIPYHHPDENPEDAILFDNNLKRTALSGSHRKYSMNIQDGLLKLADGQRKSHYILKVISERTPNHQEYAANEHITMQLAEQVFKIETTPNGLCFFEGGEMSYFVRRFDIAGKENKFRAEDFATLAGVSPANAGLTYKYDHYSYEDMADMIKDYIPAWQVEVLKFFRLILFNFLFSNGDAHLKKFSIIETKDGDFRLAPAYSLLNTRIHGSEVEFALERGLFKENNRKLYKGGAWAIGATFRIFGLRIGLPEKIIEKELRFFMSWHPDIERLVNQSFLSEETRKLYFAQYRLRRRRLIDMEL